MELEILKDELTVCRVASEAGFDLSRDFYFIGRTDEEFSLVCRTSDVPEETLEREEGWKGFRIKGVLDFSLIGILSKITGILAEKGIGIFAVSTYNTDYVLMKADQFDAGMKALEEAGYTIL